jgi:DNA repair exonuclease SbcCD ATPase subunit
MTLEEYSEKINKAEAKSTLLKEKYESNCKLLADSQANSVFLDEAQIFLQDVAKETQEQIRFNIEDIVNSCLDAVFPSQYVFCVIFEIKRGKTEARMVLMDGEKELDAMSANGGGLIQILSFALRVALLIISKNRKVLIFDEPFVAVSADLEARAYEIMQKISKEMGIQVVMVSHREAAISIADKVISVTKKNGVSIVQ